MGNLSDSHSSHPFPLFFLTNYFDTSPQIVFSEAWWIGTEDENPEEACLDFPNDFNEVWFSLNFCVM